MDSSGHMILPKGFVVNSEDIYKEVASYPVVPPEKIREYWGVYTTTFRRLIDPTANRLENFWWHVWGSDRKHLSGKTLALIFEEISTGPTIAPLQGPPNRWEPPVFGDQPPPWKTKKTSDESSASDSKSTKSSVKNGTSTSKPQPPPILKKARGDSKSGPRPTARFAEDDGEASSGSASPAAVEMRRTSSEMRREKKRGVPPKKQFHASVGAKRRPALSRRISSQTSASPEMAGKEEGSKGAKQQGQRRSVEETGAAAVTLEKAPGLKVAGKRSTARPGLDRKTSHDPAGKRPAGRPGLERRISHEVSRKATSNQRPESVPQTRSLEDVRRQHSGTAQEGNGVSNRPDVSKSQHTQTAQASNKEPEHQPPGSRSQTHAEPRKSEPSAAKAARPALASEPTASTTTVAARGTIIDFDSAPPQPQMATVPETADVFVPRQSSATSLLDSRLTPTRPSAAPVVRLGRTRSQLTLLLERERERLGESGG